MIAGMTGVIESVLGIDPRQSVEGFLGGLPGRYRAPEGPAKLQQQEHQKGQHSHGAEGIPSGGPHILLLPLPVIDAQHRLHGSGYAVKEGKKEIDQIFDDCIDSGPSLRIQRPVDHHSQKHLTEENQCHRAARLENFSHEP